MDTQKDATPSFEVEQRQRDVENALGSLRIEGLEIDAQTRAIANCYIKGEISGDEMTQAILRLR